MSWQAAPPLSSAPGSNQNLAQPMSTIRPAPPVFIATFQAAPLPSSVNQQTVGYPIG